MGLPAFRTSVGPVPHSRQNRRHSQVQARKRKTGNDVGRGKWKSHNSDAPASYETTANNIQKECEPSGDKILKLRQLKKELDAKREKKPNPVEGGHLLPRLPYHQNGSWCLSNDNIIESYPLQNDELKENHTISFSSPFYTNHTCLHSQCHAFTVTTKAWLIQISAKPWYILCRKKRRNNLMVSGKTSAVYPWSKYKNYGREGRWKNPKFPKSKEGFHSGTIRSRCAADMGHDRGDQR